MQILNTLMFVKQSWKITCLQKAGFFHKGHNECLVFSLGEVTMRSFQMGSVHFSTRQKYEPLIWFGLVWLTNIKLTGQIVIFDILEPLIFK